VQSHHLQIKNRASRTLANQHGETDMTGLEIMAAEINECVDLLRPHYPNATDEELHNRAETMRAERYKKGRWPSGEEIEKTKAKEEKAAAEAIAVNLAA
jgi:hypothetical protein